MSKKPPDDSKLSLFDQLFELDPDPEPEPDKPEALGDILPELKLPNAVSSKKRRVFLSLDPSEMRKIPAHPLTGKNEEDGVGTDVKNVKYELELKKTRSRFAPSIPGSEQETIELHAHSVFIPRKARREPWYHIHCEVAIPFIVAGTGMVVAGYLLDLFACYEPFNRLHELTVLITPLLGLKGNLEMTLATRLCTHVNLGHFDSFKKRLKASIKDLMLSQFQAIVCGFTAGIFACIIVALEEVTGHNIHHYRQSDRMIIVLASSILTASCASAIIGSIIIFVIFTSARYNVNPDNVATPVAAFLGDVLTLVLLWFWSSVFIMNIDTKDHTKIWIPAIVVVVFLVGFLPLLLYMLLKDAGCRKILKECWLPVITGLLISTAAGIILEKEGGRYINFNLYQPVINGVGGNLSSIQYSRIATAYNREAKLGTLPEVQPGSKNKVCNNPVKAACYQGQQSTSSWVLISLVIPGQINFAMITYFLIPNHIPDCFERFLVLYTLASLIQVTILMYLTLTLTNFLWKHKIDPDSYVIPLVTATGDLLGTSLLFAVCAIVYELGDCSNGLNAKGKSEHAHCNEELRLFS